MPFPRFMLMRGSLRGNGNQCWTTHWSGTKLLPAPALPGRNVLIPSEQPCPHHLCPGNNAPTRGFGSRFAFWRESCPPVALYREQAWFSRLRRELGDAGMLPGMQGL